MAMKRVLGAGLPLGGTLKLVSHATGNFFIKLSGHKLDSAGFSRNLQDKHMLSPKR